MASVEDLKDNLVHALGGISRTFLADREECRSSSGRRGRQVMLDRVSYNHSDWYTTPPRLEAKTRVGGLRQHDGGSLHEGSISHHIWQLLWMGYREQGQ